MDEKITITTDFTRTEVAAALLCLGVELNEALWKQISQKQPIAIDWNLIADKNDRLQAKLGLIAVTIGSACPNID